MTLRRLGASDLKIAPLVLGGNVFGWTADRAASFAVNSPNLPARVSGVSAARSRYSSRKLSQAFWRASTISRASSRRRAREVGVLLMGGSGSEPRQPVKINPSPV